MGVKQPDNLDLLIEQDGSFHSAVERLCAAMEQRFRQIIVKESTPADHEWLTVEDVAQELKVSQSIVYRWIETGNLRAVDLRESNGRRGQRGFYRIRRSMLDEFLASRETQSSPGTEQKVRPVKRLPKMKNYLKL